jgi:hypothetical protein
LDDAQQELRDLVNDDADGSLYHYTSLEALNGIVSNKTIWASHIKYLNDTSEQTILGNLIQDRILERLATQPSIVPKQWDVLFSRGRELFVVCFSEDGGDRLSQWRAYGGNSGVCLKFKKTALMSYCHESNRNRGVVFKKIDYVSPEGDARLNPLAEKILKGLNETGSDTSIPAQVAIEGAFLKHEAFLEEKEWRVLVLQTDQALKHRVRGSLLVPYIELDLKTKLGDLLEAVIVGPISHKEQTAEAIKGLLGEKDLRCVEVWCSKTPYRGL